MLRNDLDIAHNPQANPLNWNPVPVFTGANFKKGDASVLRPFKHDRDTARKNLLFFSACWVIRTALGKFSATHPGTYLVDISHCEE